MRAVFCRAVCVQELPFAVTMVFLVCDFACTRPRRSVHLALIRTLSILTCLSKKVLSLACLLKLHNESLDRDHQDRSPKMAVGASANIVLSLGQQNQNADSGLTQCHLL